ncbi:hypothetical protein ACFSAA_10960 [Sphingomonas qilianensis]
MVEAVSSIVHRTESFMSTICNPHEYEARAARARQFAESSMDAECCAIHRRTAASYSELARLAARMDQSKIRASMISHSEMSTSTSMFGLRR